MRCLNRVIVQIETTAMTARKSAKVRRAAEAPVRVPGQASAAAAKEATAARP
jgi:hypothetical protein